MNRLYVVEGSPTSDRRLRRPPPGPAQLRDRGLRPGGRGGRGRRRSRARSTTPGSRPIVKDLKRAGARALVIAGESQPPAVHALAHAMNEALGAVGTTVTYTAPAEAAPVGETAALSALVARDAVGGRRGPRDPGLEPGLRRPGRPRLREGARQGAAPDPPRALPRRDGGALPLAPAGLARARELGRPARRRRDGLDRPAAHRAALQHALRDRGPGRLRRGRAEGLRRRPRPLGGAARRGATSRSAGTARSTTGSWPAPPSRRRR